MLNPVWNMLFYIFLQEHFISNMLKSLIFHVIKVHFRYILDTNNIEPIHPRGILFSKYNSQTWCCTALTFNTLSYVQWLPKLKMFFFPSQSVLDKLKAQPVSKRPIHKGEKVRQRLWQGGPVKNLCWPSHPSAHLSLTTVHWYISPRWFMGEKKCHGGMGFW